MARVPVHLPSMLASVSGGKRELLVEASTLAEALAVLRALHPSLGRHLFDEAGKLRPHVLCFHNDTNTRWLSSLDVPVKDGDSLTILQAVSGGNTRSPRPVVPGVSPGSNRTELR